VLAGMVVANVVLRYFREIANTRLSMTMVYYIREAVYDKIQRVGFSFHDKVSTGQLINRALTDLQNVRAFIQTALLVTLGDRAHRRRVHHPDLHAQPVAGAGGGDAAAVLDVVHPAVRQAGSAGEQGGHGIGGQNVSILAENIAGVHVVKAFAKQTKEIEKYNAACDSYYEKVRARIRLYAAFTPIIRTIATISHLSLYLLGGIFIITGYKLLGHKLEVGAFLVLGTAMGAILQRLQQVAVISEQYQNAIVSSRRLYEVLAAPPAVAVHASGGKPLPVGPGSVSFEGVWFGYDPAKPVLKDVSFHIPGGKVVAIVGPTGGGKTTLVSLIARFYDPQRGRIVIDGVDIREFSLDELRAQVAFVFQETHLFSDTVEANVAYGKPLVRGGAVEAAARLAQAHDFVRSHAQGIRNDPRRARREPVGWPEAAPGDRPRDPERPAHPGTGRCDRRHRP